MMRLKQYVGIALAAVWVLACGSPRAGELDPAALTYKLPSQIEWKAPFGGLAGVETAVLAGDPSKPGFYAVMVKWAPGNHFSRPHFHPHDRFITVLKGTWWVGTGTKFDPDSTVPMPAGSFVVHYARGVHYDGAKDEEAILLIVGDGPETPTPAETK
jgi:quercetin dioxygenase-like cupin family protein